MNINYINNYINNIGTNNNIEKINDNNKNINNNEAINGRYVNLQNRMNHAQVKRQPNKKKISIRKIRKNPDIVYAQQFNNTSNNNFNNNLNINLINNYMKNNQQIYYQMPGYINNNINNQYNIQLLNNVNYRPSAGEINTTIKNPQFALINTTLIQTDMYPGMRQVVGIKNPQIPNNNFNLY